MQRKHVFILLSLAVISILLAGQIPYPEETYAGLDLWKYRWMAEAFPNIATDIPHPFAYRILAPWIAGGFPFPLDVSFFILNALTLILLSVTVYVFFIREKIEPLTALTVAAIFTFNKYFFGFLAFDYFQWSDTLSYLLLLLSLFAVQDKRPILFTVLLLTGVCVREVAVLIIPVAMIYLFVKKASRDVWIVYGTSIALGIIAFIGLRLLIPVSVNGSYSEQLLMGAEKFFTIESLTKKFFFPIAPFSLIPFIFYRESYLFAKKYPHLIMLFVGTAVSSLFGFDHERLMTPAAPVYYLFLAFALQSMLQYEEPKNKKRFLIVMALAAFAGSFYHLWGIIRLPNREITFIVTLSLLAAVTIMAFIQKKTGTKAVPVETENL